MNHLGTDGAIWKGSPDAYNDRVVRLEQEGAVRGFVEDSDVGPVQDFPRVGGGAVLRCEEDVT